jgi:hypothetical protein
MEQTSRRLQNVQASSFGGKWSHNLVRLQGFRAVPKEDKLALMEALYTKGPLAVSIDAGAELCELGHVLVVYTHTCCWCQALIICWHRAGNPSFRFYSSGV